MNASPDPSACVPRRLGHLPESLSTIRLAEPKPSASPSWQTPNEVCLTGEPRVVAAEGEVHTIEYRYDCDDHPMPFCGETRAYADALAAAFATSYEPPPHQAGPYVFHGPDTELLVHGDDSFEGNTMLRLRLVRRTAHAICRARDGFAEFHAELLRAVRADERERVAGMFVFPFINENNGVLASPFDSVTTSEDFSRKYDLFFKSAPRANYPRDYPSESPRCYLANSRGEDSPTSST